MTMHLAQGLSTISTKKRKIKLTKAKLAELELRWRKHNKECKQKHMHHMRYDIRKSILIIAMAKQKCPDPCDYKHTKSRQQQRNWRAEADKDPEKKYPNQWNNK